MNKPSLFRKGIGKNKQKTTFVARPPSLLWEQLLIRKAVVAKNVREGNAGMTTGKISYPFFPVLLEAKLPCSVSHSYFIYVHSLTCNPQCCWHLGSMPDSKGNHVNREAAVCKLFAMLYHGIPQRLILSVQLLPFYRGRNCSWELPSFPRDFSCELYLLAFTCKSAPKRAKKYIILCIRHDQVHFGCLLCAERNSNT